MINVKMNVFLTVKIKIIKKYVSSYLITLIIVIHLIALMKKKIAYLKNIIIPIMKQKNVSRQKKIVVIEDIKDLRKTAMMNVH